MKYRVRIDLSFSERDPAEDIYEKALEVFPEARTTNEGSEQEEIGYLRLERCYHDEDRSKCCDLIEQYLTSQPPI